MRATSLLASTAALAAAVCLPSLAAAQPANTAPDTVLPAPAPAPAPVLDTSDDLNPSTALALSLGATFVGYASFAAMDQVGDDAENALGIVGSIGVTLGPSFGHFYQGDVWTRGLGIRLAGSAAMIYGISTVDFFCLDSCDNSDDDLGGALLIGGLAAFMIGSADDIISAPYAANRRNKERHQRALTMSVAPRITGKDAGFVVAGTF